jgi:Flp pilus assembly pilin Flp
MPNLFTSLLRDEDGQDLIEYSLLIALVALSSSAILLGAGKSVSGVWKTANTTLATANTVAAS